MYLSKMNSEVIAADYELMPTKRGPPVNKISQMFKCRLKKKDQTLMLTCVNYLTLMLKKLLFVLPWERIHGPMKKKMMSLSKQ